MPTSASSSIDSPSVSADSLLSRIIELKQLLSTLPEDDSMQEFFTGALTEAVEKYEARRPGPPPAAHVENPVDPPPSRMALRTGPTFRHRQARVSSPVVPGRAPAVSPSAAASPSDDSSDFVPDLQALSWLEVVDQHLGSLKSEVLLPNCPLLGGGFDDLVFKSPNALQIAREQLFAVDVLLDTHLSAHVAPRSDYRSKADLNANMWREICVYGKGFAFLIYLEYGEGPSADRVQADAVIQLVTSAMAPSAHLTQYLDGVSLAVSAFEKVRGPIPREPIMKMMATILLSTLETTSACSSFVSEHRRLHSGGMFLNVLASSSANRIEVREMSTSYLDLAFIVAQCRLLVPMVPTVVSRSLTDPVAYLSASSPVSGRPPFLKTQSPWHSSGVKFSSAATTPRPRLQGQPNTTSTPRLQGWVPESKGDGGTCWACSLFERTARRWYPHSADKNASSPVLPSKMHSIRDCVLFNSAMLEVSKTFLSPMPSSRRPPASPRPTGLSVQMVEIGLSSDEEHEAPASPLDDSDPENC